MDARIKAVTFDEEEHRYFFNGRELHGITGAIGKLMGKSFPQTDTVKLATLYGSDVHKDVENYFNKGNYWFNDRRLSTNGAQWVVDTLKDFCSYTPEFFTRLESEVMVSDFEGTASKIDIVLTTQRNTAYLFDIKTTSHFDRAYCSLQLSVYRKLFEAVYGIKVEGLYVLATKLRRSFRIIDTGDEKVNRVLSMNKEGKD